jgi:Uma2 family endonuclease
MATTLAPKEQRFVLDGVDWEFYEALLRRIGDRHVFITFDQGRLELMSPSWKHGTRSRRIAMLITILAEELDIPIQGGGSTTFRREDVQGGLEPDQCFYVQNVERIRGKEEIDLTCDPPPDLAVEVEISRRSLHREGVYARLQVPELWKDDGRVLRVYRLDEAGRYTLVERSPSFPDISLKQVGKLLEKGGGMDDTAWSREVRAWIRKETRKETRKRR